MVMCLVSTAVQKRLRNTSWEKPTVLRQVPIERENIGMVIRGLGHGYGGWKFRVSIFRGDWAQAHDS